MSKKRNIIVAVLTISLVFTSCVTTSYGAAKKTKPDKIMTTEAKVNQYKKKIDSKYALGVLRQLSSKSSHPQLGFRLSGSKAEKQNADYIYKEYKKMGLKNVTVDKFKADGWEFKKGKLTYNEGKRKKSLELSSYPTTFVTNGPKQYELVYAGKGYKDDYKALKARGIDVKGKIVLIDTDQYNEYWINFPSYEAHVQGVKAVIACENPTKKASAFSAYSDDQMQSNDACSIDTVPALSISRNSRQALLDQINVDADKTIKISLDVDARVKKNAGSQNVWAEIPGKSKETIIVMSHYDSYFHAALDDADGTAINMTLAKAIVESGIVPEKTIRFIHHGAEEWGCPDQSVIGRLEPSDRLPRYIPNGLRTPSQR